MDKMSEISTYERKSKGLVIRISTISMLLICFLMILPDDAFSFGSLYESLTPSSITYIWLNYKFGILQLIILVIGLYEAIRLSKKTPFVVLGVMLIRELLLITFQDNSIFKASAYEMYLTIAVGYSFVLWTEGAMKTPQREEQLFGLFLVTNMLTLYINFAMGGSGGIIAGRYHSSNLDVGGTGTVCVLCVLFYLWKTEKKWYHYVILVLSIVGLFLSGSRANLLFMLAVLLARAIYISVTGEAIKEKTNKRDFFNKVVIGFLLIAVVSFIIITNWDSILKLIVGSRFQGMFNLQQLSGDDSFIGRTRSLQAGLDVLKSNPLGISGYFINLQSEIRLRNYPTFPHSTLLSMYLLFGPIVLLVIFRWVKLMVRDHRKAKNKYFWILLYILISNIIYGGPITNFKLIFILAMTTRMAALELNLQANTDSVEV